MAEKAFTQIKEAESQARALIKNAGDEASQIIKSAEKSAEDSFLQFSETRKKQALDRRNQIETDSQKTDIEFSAETEKLCGELKEKLSLKKSKAVDEIIQVIVKQI